MNARVDTISALASVLQCSIPYLMGETADPSRVGTTSAKAVWLSVNHEVGVGYWQDPAAAVVINAPKMPISSSPDYDGAEQWLERVLGNGAERLFPAGYYVHVVKVDDAAYIPRVSDVVILLHRRGDLVERSIREVQAIGPLGAMLVCPVAKPTAAQTVHWPNDGMSVAGRVIGAYFPLD